MAKRSDNQQSAARFPAGSRVRVKAGVAAPDFPDIPLGGWTGKVQEVSQEVTPPLCLVAWDRYTLHHMHPVYRSRCEREGLDLESMWLGEDDLEPDRGEPAAIEQPTGLTKRPLDPNDQEDRIRVALGVPSGDDPIPQVREEALRRYYQHLEAHLSFPFEARLSSPIGPHQDTRSPLKVLRLIDADTYGPEETAGLICKAQQNRKRIELPLDRIDVPGDSPNRQVLEDYCFWMANWA